jgi:hypothetical protein
MLNKQLSTTISHVFICALLLTSTSRVCMADSTQGTAQSLNWARPAIAAPICLKPPRIDGILDDACWKTAAHAAKFYRLTSQVSQQTEAWICADSSHLYVAFHCLDNQPHAIKASENQRNGNTSVDDYVSVDIDSQNDHHNYSQFIVTARGTQNENLEGGTADNITWAGDWHAATRRTNDGWNVEISIPWALMRYPRGSHSFGIMLERKLARETTSEFWPDRPPVSQNNPVEYFGNLVGINPTFYRPQPIFLPYVLGSAGEGNSLQEGLDVKYPLTSGLTGLATLHPDFSTVEQNVTGINFTYTEKFINDQRPFFEEGSGFFPYSDIFYSPSIGNIDEGVKVTGKEGETSLAMLGTTEGGQNFQAARVLSVQQDLNPLSNLEFDYAGDNQAGLAANNVIKTQGVFGWHAGRDQWLTYFTHTATWVAGEEAGEQEFYELQYQGPRGHPVYMYQYQGYTPNYVSDLGYVPQVNWKGPSYEVSQSNTFDHGYVQHYFFNANYMDQSYWDGGFFQNQLSASFYANTHFGDGVYFSTTESRRIDFRDHVNEYYTEWSNNSQFGGGNIDYQAGTQDDQHYRWWQIYQGYGLTKFVNMSFEFSWQMLGPTISSQTIFTPQYRLTSERSIGGRIVNQNNQTDIYLSYAQKVRTGSDIYLLFGDPNSPVTRGLVEMKIVTPF